MESLERVVLEASPAELDECLPRLSPGSQLEAYARVLLAYLRGRPEDIEASALALNGLPLEIARWRLALRRCEERADAGARAEFASAPALWRAELHFVLAMHHETFERDAQARADYTEARRLFQEAGARRKSVKAYHNAVVIESRLQPERRLIPEYQQAARWAMDAGDYAVAGAALNNLSREFHLMGAQIYALKVSQEAVDLLRTHAYASYTFSMALCHLGQLHLEQGHQKAAMMDFEEASASQLPEVRAALQVLGDKLRASGLRPGVQVEGSNAALRPRSWTERISETAPGVGALSSMESKLIEVLSHGDYDRHALIRELWGDEGNYFDLENRLKQLLHRVRKKRVDLLGYADGRYFLLDGWKAS